MNRFKFTEKSVARAIKVLKKELPKSKAPNFLKRFPDITQKNGKLFYEEKEIIAKIDVEKTVRDLLYNKDSIVPWAKESGYAALSKKYIGISRRAFQEVVNRQRIKVQSDNVPPSMKKAGRKLSKKGVIEVDLFFISRKDLPKDLQGSLPITDIKNTNPQAYVLSAIDKLTSLYFGEYLGSGKNSKSRKNVMKAVRRAAKFFSERLSIPIKSLYWVRDAGTEFSPTSQLKGRVTKLGPAVEAVNSHVQRIAHRLWAAKRGGLNSVIKQAMAIKNNTKSTVSKMTPDDAAEKEGKELAPAYNKKRSTGDPGKNRKLGIGSLVRIVTKDKKSAFYKAYQKKQYTKKLYRIQRVSKNRPYRYFVGGLWKSRDQISGPRKPIDEESEKLLASRTQWGNPIKVVSPAEVKAKKVVKKKAAMVEKAKWKAKPRKSTRAKTATKKLTYGKGGKQIT